MADPRRIRERLGFGYGAPSSAMSALEPFHAGVDPAYMPEDVVTESPWEGPRSWVRSGLESLFSTFAPSERAASNMAEKVTNLSDFVNVPQEAFDVGQEIGNTLQGGDPRMLAMSLIPGKADKLVPAVKAAQKSIKAYHGTPHDFDKFSLEKIGTGEGAQAYGHGLYFADSEDVARSYRDALAPHSASFEDNPLDTPKAYWETHDALEQDDWRKAKALDYYSKQSGPAEERLRATRDWYRDQPDMMAAIDALEPKLGTKSQGHMYEVNINADPDAFLDWDKPLPNDPKDPLRGLLYDQSSELRNSVYGDQRSIGQEAARQVANPNLTGEGLHHQLSRITGDKAKAAEAIKAAGIPGIKYLDAGSRNGQYWMDVANDGTISVLGPNRESFGTFPTREEALAFSKQKNEGSASRNWVVFDENIIDIVKKYGIAGALGAGLITQQMADQLEAQQGGGQS